MSDFLLLEDFPTLSLKAGDRVSDEQHDVDKLVRQGIAIVPYAPGAQDGLLRLFRHQRRLRPGLSLWSLLGSHAADGLSLARTVRPVTLHVDGVSGSDAGDGTTSAPLATIVEAERRVALAIADDVVVRVKANPGTGYVWPTWRTRTYLSNRSIWVIFDDVTELLSGAAQAGSGLGVVVTTGGLVADALNGKTVEVLTGAAAGDRRTILRNTTTDIEPVANFSAAIADTDTFRVFEPDPGNLVLPVDDEPMVLGVGTSESAPLQETDAVPSVRLVNAIIEAPGDLNYCADARLCLFGCEIDRAATFSRSHGSGQVLFGRTSWEVVEAPAVEGVSDTAWVGWGAFWTDGFPLWNGSVGFVSGFVVATGWSVFTGFHEISGHITDGEVRCIGENNAEDTRLPRLGFGPMVPNRAPSRALSRVANTSSNPAFDCQNEALVIIGDTIIDSTTVCIRARDARIRVRNNVTLNTGTVGLKADRTGEIAILSTGTITVGTLSGNEVEVGNTPATATIASLAAAGAFLKDAVADDNSIVHTI